MNEVWPIVTTVGTDEEATLIAGFLDSREIPARVDSRIFHQEPVTFGQLGNAHVRVPEEHLEEARRLLTEAEDLPDPFPGSDPGSDPQADAPEPDSKTPGEDTDG